MPSPPSTISRAFSIKSSARDSRLFSGSIAPPFPNKRIELLERLPDEMPACDKAAAVTLNTPSRVTAS